MAYAIKPLPFIGRGLVRVVLGLSTAALVAAFAGIDGLAAWSVASSLSAISAVLAAEITTAGAPGIAAALGANDLAAVRRLTHQALLSGVAMALLQVGLALVILAGDGMGLIAPEHAAFTALLVMAEAAATLADGVGTAMLGRNLGRSAAMGEAASNAFQILAAAILIPNLGLPGHALGMLAAALLEAIIQGWQGRLFVADMLAHCREARRTPLGLLRWAEVREQVVRGVGAGAAEASRNVLYATNVQLMAGISNVGVAGLALHAAVIKVSNIQFRVYGSLQGLLGRELAEAMGAGNPGLVREILGSGLRVLLGWGLVTAIAYAVIPHAAWNLLTPGVTQEALAPVVLVMILGVPVEAAGTLATAWFRALRRADLIFVFTTAPAIVMVGVSWVLLGAGWGVAGVLTSYSVDAAAGTLYGLYHYARWRRSVS